MTTNYTKEEVREMFLEGLREIADFWANVETNPPKTIKERCDGLVFSILNIFDGTTADMPAMSISLEPHEDDKSYYQAEGKKWFEQGMVINDDVHLHDMYYRKEDDKAS